MMKVNIVALYALTTALFAAIGKADEGEVALIIGGASICSADPCPIDSRYFRQDECGNDPYLKNLDTVELIGCPGYVDYYLKMPAFPYPVTFTSGVWVEEEKKVIVCGGLDCFSLSGYGNSHKECFWWDPKNPEAWTPGPSMTQGRTAHILGLIPYQGKTRVFAIGGYPDQGNNNYTTEILLDNGWERYSKDLPTDFEPHDNAFGCMVQDGEYLYSVRKRVTRLHMTDWTHQVLYELDFEHGPFTGQCTVGTNDGKRGILIQEGYFFVFESNTFIKIDKPPTPINTGFYMAATINNVMTIFGTPVCNDDVCRTGTSIYQYNDRFNTWTTAGKMKQDRLWHEIIPIPKSICELTLPTPTTTTPGSSSDPTSQGSVPTTSGATSVGMGALVPTLIMAVTSQL